MRNHFLFEGSNILSPHFSTESHLYFQLHEVHQCLNYNFKKNNSVFYYFVVLGSGFSCIPHEMEVLTDTISKT